MADERETGSVSSDALRAAVRQAIKDELVEAELANPEERKALFKEAVKEWVQENAQAFGWWSIKTLGGLAILVLVYLVATMKGWSK